MKVKSLLLDIFFPKFCVECGREGKYICEKCYLFASETELLRQAWPVGMINVWEYNGIIKKALHEVKYRYTRDILNELIEKGFKIILNDKYRFNDFLSFLINEKAVITYVPMYKKKERYRGFNQSKIIAQKIGKIFNLEVVELLKKTRETKSQTKLCKEERIENVRDSFKAIARQARPVGERSILLVDDIYTTGATMHECCKVLKKSGIKNIWTFTLAKTP